MWDLSGVWERRSRSPPLWGWPTKTAGNNKSRGKNSANNYARESFHHMCAKLQLFWSAERELYTNCNSKNSFSTTAMSPRQLEQMPASTAYSTASTTILEQCPSFPKITIVDTDKRRCRLDAPTTLAIAFYGQVETCQYSDNMRGRLTHLQHDHVEVDTIWSGHVVDLLAPVRLVVIQLS